MKLTTRLDLECMACGRIHRPMLCGATPGKCSMCGAGITYLSGVGGCPRCDWGTMPEKPGDPVWINDPHRPDELLTFWPYPEHGSFYAIDEKGGGALLFAPMLSTGAIETNPDMWGEVAWGMVDEETEAECERIRAEIEAKGDA